MGFAVKRNERHERHEELDEIISAWTIQRNGVELMEALQAIGVAAHIVQNSPELTTDPQMTHRGLFAEVIHGTHEPFFVDGTRFHLSRTPAKVTHAGPVFGEHTFEVLTDDLGYDSDRIAELAIAELLE